MALIRSDPKSADGENGSYRDAVDRVAPADFEPAIAALDEHAEVRWTATDPARFDALWNYLFGLAESGGTVDSDADINIATA